MPTNQFTLLLQAVDAEQPNHQAALASLAQFKLFALVIVDFERDGRVIDEIGIRWTRLDQMTGPNLLFVAPCVPPSAWSNSADVRARGYVDVAMGNLERMQREALELADPGAAMSRLTALLGLRPRPMPVLVVFERIDDTAGWEIETSAGTIADDLLRLGGVASDLADGIVGDAGVAVAEKFGASRYVGRFERCSGTAAEAVVAATAGSLLAHSREGRGGRHDAWFAEPFLTRLLERRVKEARELLRQLKSVQDADGHDAIAEDYEQGLVALAEAAGVFCEVQTLGIFGKRFKAELPAHWERWSVDMLERGDRCYSWGTFENSTGATPHEWQTPAAICWCLAVEHELASCLGHAIREELGVHLPPSWWSVDRRAGKAEVEVHGAKVKLNEGKRPKRRRTPWQPPPLGTLRIAAVALVEQGRVSKTLVQAVGAGDWPEFVELCTQIGQARNRFAHPGEESGISATALRRDLIPKLWRTKVMQLLVAQKTKWSGQPNPQRPDQDRIARWAEDFLG